MNWKTISDIAESAPNSVGLLIVSLAFIADSYISSTNTDAIVDRINAMEVFKGEIATRISNIDKNISMLIEDSRSYRERDKDIYIRVNVLESKVKVIEEGLKDGKIR